MSPPAASPRTTRRAAFAVLRNEPVAYAIAWVQWVTFHSLPLAIGWAFKVVLDRIADDPGGASPWAALAVLGGLEVGRWSLLVSAAVQWHGAFVGWETAPRVNLLRSLTTAPGARSGTLPGSPGEAVSRFRDDAQDLAMVLDVWLDVSGIAVASGAAVAVMASIDARVTVAVVVPVAAALAIGRRLGHRLRAWRHDARRATAEVTGFLGDAFGAVLAVKAAAAESSVADRFAEINARRAVAARRDEVGTQLVQSLSGTTGQVGIGVLLLVVAPAVGDGDFTVGQLGLFTSYVTVLAGLPRWVGRLGAYHRQADVSVARLAELRPDGDAAAVVAPVATHLRHGPPPLAPPRIGSEPFEELRVEGLVVRLGDAVVLDGVDLVVGRGELVVVTGPVGAGKSTLLRALLGLVPVEGGQVRWNGRVVDDPSTFLVPSRTAYVPQVPRLFSEPLADTILLGWPDDALAEALRLACLDDDVAAMPDGARTLVGARGVRLSGGQVQRAGTARALARRPELLVVDDLSSALDVETEARLWDRLLADGGRSALVVSHRPHVLAQADRVVVVEGGRVVS